VSEEPFIYRGLPEKFQALGEGAIESFKAQLQSVQDQVLAGGGDMSDARSIQAHVLAMGVDWMVDEMRARGAEFEIFSKTTPLEVFIGILLNDMMTRFWMVRRIEGRDHPQMGDRRD